MNGPFYCARRCLLIVISLLFVLRFSAPVSAQIVEATRSFDHGTRALKQGAYSEAVAIFSEAESLGLGSVGLFYNRAVAHYRMDEIGQAIRYLHRARAMDPDNLKIQHNLSIVSARIEDQFSFLPPPVWKRLQRILVSVISVNAMIAVGLGLYVILSILIIIRIRHMEEDAWIRRIRHILVSLTVLFLLGGFSSAFWPAYPDQAVVIASEALVLEQPDSEATVTERIHEGLVVTMITRVGEWVLIQLPNGTPGWTRTDEIDTI